MKHNAVVRWKHDGGEFAKGRYSRAHTWSFDGGLTIPASPSPAVVRAPYCDPSAIDPEEAFVASIASCHMLTFLHLASRAGVEVLSYDDEAVGTMTKNERGVPWVSEVVLSPKIAYRAPPTPELLEKLHHEAHEQCFIANSVKTNIVVRG
jgi:organic hydroperoxide reductase OsmC/OhrA